MGAVPRGAQPEGTVGTYVSSSPGGTVYATISALAGCAAGADSCEAYSRWMNARCDAVAAWFVRMSSYSEEL
jgi:hypothetical protein